MRNVVAVEEEEQQRLDIQYIYAVLSTGQQFPRTAEIALDLSTRPERRRQLAKHHLHGMAQNRGLLGILVVVYRS